MDRPAEPMQQSAAPPQRNPSSGLVALITGALGLFALPLIGSILALVFGYQSRSETLARPDLYVDDFGRAGRILGWVGVGLAALALLIVLAAILFLMPVGFGVR